MRSQRKRRTLIVGLASIALALPSAYAQSSGDTVYHLHGTVLNGVTGKPLSRALVISGDQRLATMTDGDGHFAFEVKVPSAPAGSQAAYTGFSKFAPNLILTARKPGFVSPEMPSLIQLNDALSSTDVTLKLMPGAVVSGRVSATGATSASNVRITLLVHRLLDGTRTWQPAGVRNTNSRGEFRFTDLAPGEYTVFSAEWRGDPFGPVPRGTVTREYPPVFIGDTDSLASAGKLRLHFGETAQAELHLQPTSYFPILIPVTSDSGAVNVRIGGDAPFGAFQLGWNARDHAVEGSLPDGDYQVVLNSYGEKQSLAVVPLHVAGAPVQTAAIALTPTFSVPVHVRTEFTNSQDSGPNLAIGPAVILSGNRFDPEALQNRILVQLFLRPADGMAINTPVGVPQPGNPGELELENVQPGIYYVRPMAMRGYVASLTSGNTNLLEHPLTIGATGRVDPIEVTLRDDGATLSGTVSSGNEPLPLRTMIFIMSTTETSRTSQSFAGPQGRFSASNLAPGSYRVFALSSPQAQLPYNEPEAMRHLDGKGTSVSLSAGQNATIEVPLLDDADLEVP